MEFTRKTNPITDVLQFVKKEWKPFIMVFIIFSTYWLGVILCLISLQGFEVTAKQFGSVNLFYANLVNTIIKNTITYYILIFKLAIPMIRTRKWKKVLFQYLLFLLILTIYEYFWNFKISVLPPSIRKIFPPSVFFIVDMCFNVLMALISTFIATWMESNNALKRRSELEKQKLNAELSAIRYQINPHFLFNSLSFIYTKTVKQNPEAAHAVHLLSEIMSYALEEWEDLGRVPLALEITHMKKVIEMNRIRFNNKLNVNYEEEIADGGNTALNNAHVPTLIFITLVENAFKHGELNDEKDKVVIMLKVSPGNIFFSIRNRKKKGTKEPSHGIGVSNVQQRLKLMYGAGQSFIIKQNGTHYSTEITINLIKP